MSDDKAMTFDYCASCGGNLDTGWECVHCGRDWMPYAAPMPWWKRLLASLGLVGNA